MISDDLYFTSLSDRNGISLLLTINGSDRLVPRDELIRSLGYRQVCVANFMERAEADGLIDIIVEERPRRTFYLRCTDLGFRVSKIVSAACLDVYGTEDVRDKSVCMMHGDPVLRWILDNPGCSVRSLMDVKSSSKALKPILSAMQSEGLVEMEKNGRTWSIDLTDNGERMAAALKDAFALITENRPEFVLHRAAEKFLGEHPEYAGFLDESQSEVLTQERAVSILEMADADPDRARSRTISDAVVSRLLRQSGFGDAADVFFRSRTE